MKSNPASSAVRATSLSAGPRVEGPSGLVKSGIWSPIFTSLPPRCFKVPGEPGSRSREPSRGTASRSVACRLSAGVRRVGDLDPQGGDVGELLPDVPHRVRDGDQLAGYPPPPGTATQGKPPARWSIISQTLRSGHVPAESARPGSSRTASCSDREDSKRSGHRFGTEVLGMGAIYPGPGHIAADPDGLLTCDAARSWGLSTTRARRARNSGRPGYRDAPVA